MIPTLLDVLAQVLAGTMTNEEASFWLVRHQQLDQQVDAFELKPMSPTQGFALIGTMNKLQEQDARWGCPTVYPSFDPALLVDADTTARALAGYYSLPLPQTAKVARTARAALGSLAWMDILVYEVAKLCQYHEDQLKLRDQLLDVAAVAVQWAAQLDPTKYEEADHEGPGEQP